MNGNQCAIIVYKWNYYAERGEVSIISDVMEQVNKPEKKQLKGKLRTGTVALIIALIAVASATYAWYVYNTNRHTTKVRMAAGAGVNLQISNSYSVTYGSAAVLDSFSGQLNPVSTNRISGGFQKVLGFTNGTENQPNLVANLFGRGDYTDYYRQACFSEAMEILPISISQISALRTAMKRNRSLPQSVQDL